MGRDIYPDRIHPEGVETAQMLFADWFFYDRKLTCRNLTPLELFISEHRKKLKSKELEIYEKFLSFHKFGIYQVVKLPNMNKEKQEQSALLT